MKTAASKTAPAGGKRPAVPKGPQAAPSAVAFSYLRFSSGKQEKGDSIRRQTELREGWLKRHPKVRLDTTLDLTDRGLSGYHGHHRTKGHLGKFLTAAEEGRVPSGSILLVEDVSRLGREGPAQMLREIIFKLWDCGITLQTLSPEGDYPPGCENDPRFIVLLILLQQAHEESRRKGERLKAAWAGKRQKRRQDHNTIIAGSLPAWVEKRNGKLRLIPERAKAMRRIFALAAAGYGRSRIVQTLRAEGIPSFSGEKEWSSATISFILSDGRARGQYQPCQIGRIPDGPPIPDYYPAAVTEEQWLAARAGMAQRRRSLRGVQVPWTSEEDELVRNEQLSVGVVARRTGRSRAAVYQRRHALGLTKTQNRREKGNFINIFSGLIRNARPPHDTYIIASRMDGSGPRKALLNVAHAEGKAPCYLFQLAPFERAVLGELRELDPKEVLPPADEEASQDEAGRLQAELNGIEVELAEAAAFMESQGFSPTIGRRITELESRKKELGERLLDAKARAACPAEQAWREYGSLIDLLARSPDQRDTRLRLRAALRRIVTEIRLLVVPRGWARFAFVQVYFAGGARRSYLIFHRLVRGKGASQQEPLLFVQSWAECPADIGWACEPDLRNPAEVAKLEKGLLGLPQDEIDLYIAAAETVRTLDAAEALHGRRVG
jgi:DNA invertase Pin-like site-specific DNA recombinase